MIILVENERRLQELVEVRTGMGNDGPQRETYYLYL
jgi:hypothetical protein